MLDLCSVLILAHHLHLHHQHQHNIILSSSSSSCLSPLTEHVKEVGSSISSSNSSSRHSIDNGQRRVFVGLGCGAGPCLVAAWISGLYSHIRGIEIMHWKFMECSMLLSKLLLSHKMQQQQQQQEQYYVHQNQKKNCRIFPLAAKAAYVGPILPCDSSYSPSSSPTTTANTRQLSSSSIATMSDVEPIVTILEGNFCCFNWHETAANVVYTCATCYTSHQLQLFVSNALLLKVGTIVVMIDSMVLLDPFCSCSSSNSSRNSSSSNSSSSNSNSNAYSCQGEEDGDCAVVRFVSLGSEECRATWGTCCAYIFLKIA